ncbi:HNH endonuclease [Phytoactinopolyspora mesophila]|nr:HNH endonuclease signature motif containing protein [Phytoactinopolyspora mesophila]
MNEQMAVGEIAGMVDRLIELSSAMDDDAACVDVIAAAERLKAATAAFQLEKIAQFAASQAEAKKAMGFEARHAMRGVPEQVGLATRTSPSAAARQLSRARVLRECLPETFALLRTGEVSEFVATHVVNETSHLDADSRRAVDNQLASQLVGLGPKRAQSLARKLAIEADPEAAVARAGRARKDRRVSVRPAPDTMTVLSALLPCEQGVAAFASLRRHADALVAGGDGRSRQQIMADTLVERVTGQAVADAVSAEVGLVMTDASLFGGDDEAADVVGYGPIPAETARDLIRQGHELRSHQHPDQAAAANTNGSAGQSATAGMSGPGAVERARVFLRRLFTDPATGVVVDCDPRRRRFDGVLARLLTYRDHLCRDAFCDAPIRHIDHIQPHAEGGPTVPGNGRGTCERGNYTRELPGWRIRVVDPDLHLVETITPTGHRYMSTPPSAPGIRRRPAAGKLGRPCAA